jgi:hypothetical protein
VSDIPEGRPVPSTPRPESQSDLPGDLWNQLGHAVSMAAKEDQIVWAIFGVFWAANAVLLVALFTTGALPSPPVGIVVSASGAALSWVWFLIQRRAIGWLSYYERIIRELEEKLLVPHAVALSPGLNEATFNETVGRGVRVRPLMTGSGFVVAVLWIAALACFVCRLTTACS